MHDPDAAQPGRGHEAAHVGRRPAADRHHGVGAGEPGRAEPLPAVGDDRGGLGRLAVGHLEVEHLVAGQRPRYSPGACTSATRRTPVAQQRRQPVEHAAARPRRRTARGRRPGSWSCQRLDDLGGDLVGRPPVGVDHEGGDRLVDRRALVEQRLDPAADVAEQQRPASCRARPASPRRRARPGGTPRRARRAARGWPGRAPLRRPAPARRRGWPAPRRPPCARGRGSAPRRSPRRCRRSLRPSSASTSASVSRAGHAPGLGEQRRRRWTCRRPSARRAPPAAHVGHLNLSVSR